MTSFLSLKKNNMVNELTDSNFDTEIEKIKTPVIIDFYAIWCSPCKMVAPIVEEIAEEYKDKLTVLKANVDSCPNSASKFNVMSIPTLVFMNEDKEVINQMTGFHGKEAIMKGVYEILKS